LRIDFKDIWVKNFLVVVFWLDDISAKDKKVSYLVVVFCFGDISAEDDDPKVANPSSPIMQGDPVSIEDAAGDTYRQKNKNIFERRSEWQK
jgi:hypothetical protein